MRVRRTRALIVVGALLLIGCGYAATIEAAPSPTKPPYVVKFKWGTFKLNSKIADKLKNHKAVNVLLEGQADGLPVISKIFRDSAKAAVPGANKIYPINFRYYAPPGNAYNEPLQISQIQSQLGAGQVDCLAVVPTTSTGLNKLIDQILKKGIPVFTMGVPTSYHEFANYAQIPLKEGAFAATKLVEWMKANNKDFKVFAVTSALPPQVWAQGRMASFVATIKKLVPDAKFINDQSSAVDTTLDPTVTYDRAKAFLQGHSDVQVVMNTDIGAEHIDRAIEDLNLVGKTFTIGWNVSRANLGYIDKGVQIATFDQNITMQAQLGTTGCSTFFATGKVQPNTLALKPIFKPDVAAALKALTAAGG
jgi:ABC-type sugar transport system substrate-binding protein